MVFILHFNLWLNTFHHFHYNHSSCVASSRETAPSPRPGTPPTLRPIIKLFCSDMPLQALLVWMFTQIKWTLILVKTDTAKGKGDLSNVWTACSQRQRYIQYIFSFLSEGNKALNRLVLRRYPVSSPCNTTWLFKRTKPCSLSLGRENDNKNN